MTHIDGECIFDIFPGLWNARGHIKYSLEKYDDYENIYVTVLSYLEKNGKIVDHEQTLHNAFFWPICVIENEELSKLSIDNIIKNAIESLN